MLLVGALHPVWFLSDMDLGQSEVGTARNRSRHRYWRLPPPLEGGFTPILFRWWPPTDPVRDVPVGPAQFHDHKALETSRGIRVRLLCRPATTCGCCCLLNGERRPGGGDAGPETETGGAGGWGG